MNLPEDLKYHKEHTWLTVEGNRGTIGITNLHKANWAKLCTLTCPI